ncbi:hypothetical protein ACFLX1_00245 [Chloroflexota bacterium]
MTGKILLNRLKAKALEGAKGHCQCSKRNHVWHEGVVRCDRPLGNSPQFQHRGRTLFIAVCDLCYHEKVSSLPE